MSTKNTIFLWYPGVEMWLILETQRWGKLTFENLKMKTSPGLHCIYVVQSCHTKSWYPFLAAGPSIRDMRENPQPHPGIGTILTITENVCRNTVKNVSPFREASSRLCSIIKLRISYLERYLGVKTSERCCKTELDSTAPPNFKGKSPETEVRGVINVFP